MENFVVSARKYRPITFDAVVGQSSITNTLKNAIKNNHLAQAFLFTGPRGVGKTTCARIFAKTINCENLGKNLEPCDKCESCTSFNQNNSFNIHELDAASNNSVDDMRRLIEQVRIPPQVGEYKVYIIDEVHMLSQQAFNTFLKTLEEPPAYAKFILATTEKHKIIPTILSRCQIYDFKRITVKDTISYLKYVAKNEKVETEEDALHIIAQKADGAMRDALSIFDQIVSFSGNSITYKSTLKNLNVLDVENYFQLVDIFLAGDISSSLLIFDDIIGKGFEGHHFINGLASHLRSLLVGQDPKTIDLLETSEGIKSHYLEQSGKCDLRFLINALDICAQVDLNYKTASNKRLLVELSLMKLCKLSNPFPKVEQTSESNKPEPKSIQKTVTVSTPKPPVKEVPVQTKKTEKIVEPSHKADTIKKEIPASIVEEPKQETEINTETKAEEKQDIPVSISKPKPRRKAVSILGNLNAEPKKEENKLDLEGEMEKEFSEIQKLISRDELDNAVKSYVEKIKDNKPAFAANLKPENISLEENNKITLSLNNIALNDKDLRYNFLQFLKDNMNNREITLITKVVEVKTVAKETPLDLYKKMNKENPKLDEFRNQLDLDF